LGKKNDDEITQSSMITSIYSKEIVRENGNTMSTCKRYIYIYIYIYNRKFIYKVSDFFITTIF